MPRGRPRKMVEQPTNEQTKNSNKTTQVAREDTMTIFSSDIGEPVAGPVADQPIEESKNTDETVQDSDTSANGGSVAQVLHDKALTELNRLEAARGAILVRIAERESQAEELQAEAYVATREHSQARAILAELKRRADLQIQRTILAKGTPAEKDANRELSKLHADCAQAQAILDKSVGGLEHAQELLKQFAALQESIAVDKREIASIDEKRNLMEVLRDEQKAIRGQEIFAEVKATIEEKEQEVSDQAAYLEAVQRWLRDEQKAIQVKLADWPDLADRLITTHGIAQTASETPATRVMKAYIQFLRTLHQEGHSANVRVNGGTRNLTEVLALPAGLLTDFLTGSKWRKRVTYDVRGREVVEDVTNEIEVIEQLIQEQAEIQKRRMGSPSWWAR